MQASRLEYVPFYKLHHLPLRKRAGLFQLQAAQVVALALAMQLQGEVCLSALVYLTIFLKRQVPSCIVHRAFGCVTATADRCKEITYARGDCSRSTLMLFKRANNSLCTLCSFVRSSEQ